ncbi:MAG: IS4 family transposase [Bryobacteraceae bacterium]|nr:IS4 family transposase [Bryobacteraceae bacterium]
MLEETGRASVRERDLPARVVVYYVIALALYMRSSYREVLRCLLEGVQWLLDPSAVVKVAGKSGISQARSRLGSEPLQKLYAAIVAPIAEKRTKGAWYREWRLISLDGSTLDTADTLENVRAFGRPGVSRGASAFPKIRFVALLENGTHVLWAARMGQYRTDEIALARDVVPALRKGMLCLADRFFPGYKLWRTASQTGADLLWRTRQNARLDVDRRLPDGSYLSRIYASTSDRRNQRSGITVRVIDYRLKDVKDAAPIYRLITTILDPTQAPATELAALYHERWEIETALIPTGSPSCIPYAWSSDGWPAMLVFPPRQRKALHEAILQGILDERVVSSRDRVNLRGVKRKMSNYNLRPRKRQRTRRIDISSRIRIVK